MHCGFSAVVKISLRIKLKTERETIKKQETSKHRVALKKNIAK